MSARRTLFVFGASGHAKVVIDAIEHAGDEVRFVYDDAQEKHGKNLMGYEVVGGRAALLERRKETRLGIVGIGDNALRARMAAWLVENACELATVVHPDAAISRDVEIDAGSVVMAGCVVNAGTRIGRNVIVNTSASVDHDCSVADGVHIAPGSHLCGHVTVGAGTLVGAGTTIVPGIAIGANVLIGAGSTVLKDVPDGARVGGSPCRPLT